MIEALLLFVIKSRHCETTCAKHVMDVTHSTASHVLSVCMPNKGKSTRRQTNHNMINYNKASWNSYPYHRGPDLANVEEMNHHSLGHPINCHLCIQKEISLGCWIGCSRKARLLRASQAEMCSPAPGCFSNLEVNIIIYMSSGTWNLE